MFGGFFATRSRLCRQAIPAVVVCCTGVLALAGCLQRIHTPHQHSSEYVYTPPDEADPAFHYDKPVVMSETPTDIEFLDYRISRLSYASAGENGQAGNRVDALYYRSPLEGKRKVVIVLPIWGSHTYPPSKITRGYARYSDREANIIWILGQDALFEWETLAAAENEAEFISLATTMAERFRVTVIDVRRLLDWLGERPEIDPQRIGIVGFSMGTLVAANVLGNDERFAAGVLMMGGANPEDIFASCVGRAGAVRENAIGRLGWTLEQYRAFFAEIFRSGNPARYAGRYDPSKILMIDAHYDDCIPKSSRDALWYALGQPQRVSFLYKHRKAFYSMTPLGLNYSRRLIYRFLNEHL